VQIIGFIVQNFERAIVLDHVSNCVLRRNEIRNNLSQDPPPISAGVTKSDGILFLQTQNCEVADNFIHDNGSVGLLIMQSSGGSTIRGNRFIDNGTQQTLPGSGVYGAGIFSGAGNNTRNEIVDNEIAGSDWGILIGSGADSANAIRNNRIHGNRRAGIAISGQHNIVTNNDATGNGSMLPPSCRLDLVDFYGLDNEWSGNIGTFATDVPAVRSTCP
jgi:parallel beta-helix repeat protein